MSVVSKPVCFKVSLTEGNKCLCMPSMPQSKRPFLTLLTWSLSASLKIEIKYGRYRIQWNCFTWKLIIACSHKHYPVPKSLTFLLGTQCAIIRSLLIEHLEHPPVAMQVELKHGPVPLKWLLVSLIAVPGSVPLIQAWSPTCLLHSLLCNSFVWDSSSTACREAP